MRINGLVWLDEIVDKLARKHHVTMNEVEEVFEDKPKFRFVEKGHRTGEDVFMALGRTEAGRYLAVFVHSQTQRGGFNLERPRHG